MSKKTRSYYVERAIEPNVNGYWCHCALGHHEVERRFFKQEDDAYEYGTEWLATGLNYDR